MMYDTRHSISVIVGLFLMLLGVLPLLSSSGVISLGFHTILGGVVSILSYVVAFFGLLLIVDGFDDIMGASPPFGWVSIGFGLLILLLGLIQALNTFGVIGFSLPSPPVFVYYAIFIMEGLLLFINGFIPS